MKLNIELSDELYHSICNHTDNTIWNNESPYVAMAIKNGKAVNDKPFDELMADYCKERHLVIVDEDVWEDAKKALNDKSSGKDIHVTTKQLEDMYDSYEKSLWREREDIRGDDMVLLSDAEMFLQEELSLLGCWDDEVEEQQGENNGI